MEPPADTIPLADPNVTPPAQRAQRSSFEKSRRRMSAAAAGLFLVVALLNEPPKTRELLNESLEYFGFMLLILAAFGRIWTGAYLGGRKTKELCVTGPFSLSRNPLYFFSMLGAVGVAMLSESLILAGLAFVCFLTYYHFVIRDEAVRLREAFGPAYEDYCRRVPRLFPRLSGYVDEPTITLHTRPFRRTVLDTSLFIWIFLALELFELLEILIGHRVLPVGWRLY
jgi:protein-S-isoprenylcysteine O-methyltransferase Ste14